MMRRLTSILVVLIISLSALFAQEEMSNDAKKLFNAGEKARKTGDYAGAITKFDEALKLSSHPDIHFRKAFALMKSKQLDQAIAAFNKTIELDPQNEQAYYILGQVTYAKKDYEKAIELFEKTKEVAKKSSTKRKAEKNIKKCKEQLAFPLVLEGNNLLGDRKFEQAISSFNKAINIYERSDAYSGISNAYYEMGNYDKSIDAANKSLKVKKRNASANFFLGMAYKAKNENEKAKTHFKKCLRDKNFKERAKYELDDMK